MFFCQKHRHPLPCPRCAQEAKAEKDKVSAQEIAEARSGDDRPAPLALAEEFENWVVNFLAAQGLDDETGFAFAARAGRSYRRLLELHARRSDKIDRIIRRWE